MLSFFLQFLYGSIVLLLVWQAVRVMSRGFSVQKEFLSSTGKSELDRQKGDRTGQLTVHPELLDDQGRLTDEELLTVRFSGDMDPPKSAETSSE